MKRIVFSCFISLWLSCSLVQALPDGAVARLGKGSVFDAFFSPDGTMLMVASSVGVYLYDPATLAEIHLFEMDKAVERVSLSADSRLLAGMSSYGTIKLWDVKSRKEIDTIDIKDDSVHFVSLSPDGGLLAIGCDHKGVKLWDVKEGKEIITIDDYRSASFSPDGRLLAVGGDKGLKLWDVMNQKLIVIPSKDWEGRAYSLSFSPDGNLLAGRSASRIDGRDLKTFTRLWDVKRRVTVANLPPDGGSPVFSPDGGLLAIETGDITVKLWDVKSHELVGTLTWSAEYPSEPFVSSVSFDPDGKLLAAGSGSYRDGWKCPIQLWDVNSRKEICTLPGHGSDIDSVRFSPDGKLLVSVGERMVKLWDIENRKLVTTLSEFSEDIASISFSPDGSLLASAGGIQVKLWDVKSRSLVADLIGHSDEFVGSVCFSPDGKILASAGGRFTTVILWDVNSHKEIAKLDGDYSVCFSPDGSLLAAGGYEELYLWDVKSRELIATLPGHAEWVLSVSFSPDGSLLASGGDQGITIWDVKSGKEITTLSEHWVHSVSFSPDGKLLACGSNSGAELWNVQSKEGITILSGFAPYGISVCFNPDGRLLATGGYLVTGGKNVRLWDVKSNREIAILSGGDSPVCFSPDGSLLASGGPSGTILLWDMKPYLNEPPGIPGK